MKKSLSYLKKGSEQMDNLEDKIIEKTSESIKEIIEKGISSQNLENLYVLSKVKHMAKEEKQMNYGNYGNYGGRTPGYDTYGNYGNYGARGRDMRYRGEEQIDRMAGEYGRYQESKNRYGASEDTDKSFHYMVKALEDFIKVLHEEADTPQQKQMLRESLQRSMM